MPSRREGRKQRRGSGQLDGLQTSRHMSERLTNAEMHAPGALLQLAIHPEIGDWIELESDVHAQGAHWRHVAKAGTDVVAQVVQIEIPRSQPGVPQVEKRHRGDLVRQREAHFGRPFEHGETANGKPERACRPYLVPAPPAKALRAAQKITLPEWHVGLQITQRISRANAETIGAERVNCARAHTIGEHHRSSDRQVVARLSIWGPVVEGTGQPAARLLHSCAHAVARTGVEQAVGGVATRFERNQRQPPLELSVGWIEPECNQLVTEGQVFQRLRRYEAALELVAVRHRPGGPRARLMEQRDSPAKRVERVDRLVVLPRLPLESQGEVRAQEVRLLVCTAHPPTERRPCCFEAQLSSATEKIDMVPADPRARLFFAAVPDAKRDALLLALSHRDAHRHYGRVNGHRFIRFDLAELEP